MQKVQATKTHCKHCFDVLIARLTKKEVPPYPNTQVDAQVPIFVTWKKHGELRGCIGTFHPGKLSKILPEYAITASMKDSRFSPVKQEQIKDLSVGVSFLVNFEEGKKPYDWEVGKHGIIIKANVKGDSYSGTFLPEVAKQQQWDKKQTLEYLVKKAGYYGDFKQIQSEISLTTYESSKQYMDYKEYIEVSKL